MEIQINSFLQFLVLSFIALEIKLSVGISLDKFLTLSIQEKHQLDEFKDRVKSHLPHDYMKTDVYLIRFLRENDFNVPASEQMLQKMLRWREENDMDNILKEDFSEFEDEYRAYIEGCDNEGRPIISMNIGDWDIRRAIVSGRGQKLMRFTDRIYEEAVLMVRAMLAEGQNVTQVAMVFDLSNFNVVTHACPRCIPIYFYILISLQSHFPGYIHRIVAVNTPSYALPLWDLFKQVISPKLKEILEIFGSDKVTWQKYLFQEIDPSQLTTPFGGTQLDSLDLNDIRFSKKIFRCDVPFSEYNQIPIT